MRSSVALMIASWDVRMRLLTFTRGGIVIACALTALVFESDDCGAQSAAVSDPYKVAATRLGNLSSLLDKHLEA